MHGVDGELDSAWPQAWTRMASGGETVVINCGVGSSEAVPARYYRFEEPETGAEGVRSDSTLVALYSDAFDRCAWAHGRDQCVRRGDGAEADPATRHLHLT